MFIKIGLFYIRGEIEFVQKGIFWDKTNLYVFIFYPLMQNITLYGYYWKSMLLKKMLRTNFFKTYILFLLPIEGKFYFKFHKNQFCSQICITNMDFSTFSM